MINEEKVKIMDQLAVYELSLIHISRRSGYVRAEIDGNVYELSEEITLDKNIKHTIAIIVDRLIVKPGIEKRLTDLSLIHIFRLWRWLLICTEMASMKTDGW